MAYRSLVSILDLTAEEVDALLDAAEQYLPKIETGGFKSDTLRGTSTLLLFYEPSTRTRVSFELAGKLLGSDTINVGGKGSSIEKGESLRDNALTFAAMHHDVVVLRHPAADAAALFARHYPYAVLNAGGGCGQHPTQALLDALCLRRAGLLKPGKRLAIVGDLKHSRVMRSNLMLLLGRGLHLTLVAPPTLMPEGRAGLEPERWLAGRGKTRRPAPGTLEWETDLDRVLPRLDALMMLRVQRERAAGGGLTNLDEYAKLYGLNRRRLALLGRGASILHPGPVNRGVEVTEDVFADKRCLINAQVTCGVAVRCALLSWACGRLEPAGGGSE